MKYKFIFTYFVIILLFCSCGSEDSQPKQEVSSEIRQEKVIQNENVTVSAVEATKLPELTYSIYEISRTMYETPIKDIVPLYPEFEGFTYEANKEHTIALSSGATHTFEYIYTQEKACIIIDGQTKLIDDSIPKELLYDKVELFESEYEGRIWFAINYLYRVAPDGICIGSVSNVVAPHGRLPHTAEYEARPNYDIDDYLNLLGQNDEVLLKELGHCVGFPENDYHEIKGLTSYRYDRMGVATYDGKICAIVVAGQKMFGRAWKIEDNGVIYNEIEKYFNDDFEVKTEEVKYYDRTRNLEFVKYEYGDYILFFDMFENKIGYMVVTRKEDDGLLDDTSFVLLDEICL